MERFRYRGEEHLAPADTLVLMNPDELHTGRAETAAGWRYRMAYLDAPLLEELSGERGWWFAEAVGRDAASARTTRLLRQLWHASDRRSPSMRCCGIWSTSCARRRRATPRATARCRASRR